MMFVPEVTKIEFLALIRASIIAVSRLIRFPPGPRLLELPMLLLAPKLVVFVLIGVTARCSSSEGDIVCGRGPPMGPPVKLGVEPEPEMDPAISSLEFDCSSNSCVVLSLSKEFLIFLFVTGSERMLLIRSMFFFCFMASLKTR